MKKLFFLGACLVALSSSPIRAQAGGPDIVVVRFYNNSLKSVRVAIARGTAAPEVQDMKGDEAAQAQFCQQVIAKLYREGYTLKSTFGTSLTSSNNLVFSK